MSDLKIPFKITGLIISLIRSIIFGLLGVFLLVKVSSNDWIILIMVFFLMLVSLIGPQQLLYRITGVPALILTDYGLTNGKGKLLVKWDEIDSFTFENIKFSEYLMVKVQDVDSLINRSKGIGKYIYILNKRIGRSRKFTIISMGSLGISKLKLTEEINRRLLMF